MEGLLSLFERLVYYKHIAFWVQCKLSTTLKVRNVLK